MHEAGRYLRYVTPGVVFAIELGGLLSILRPDWISDLVVRVATEQLIGAALGALLVSGGLGYLFSSLHHALHWKLDARLTTIDHGAFIRSMITHGDLVVKGISDRQALLSEDVTRDSAWPLLTGLWHERSTSSERVAGADSRMRTLADLVHANGAARTASATAVTAAFVIAGIVSDFSLGLEPFFRFLAATVIAALLVGLHHRAYMRVGRSFQAFIEQVLAECIIEERARSGHPLVTFDAGLWKSPKPENAIDPSDADNDGHAS